jgi:CheY-like chemotaxis protein
MADGNIYRRGSLTAAGATGFNVICAGRVAASAFDGLPGRGDHPMRMLRDCRVLIVEDEVLLAMDLERVLEDAGCTSVATAATVDDALEKVREWQPDVVVLDLALRGEKSFPVADTLDDANIPFVIMSGHSPRIVPPRHAARPFLGKPSHPDLLLQTLQHLVSAAEWSAAR